MEQNKPNNNTKDGVTSVPFPNIHWNTIVTQWGTKQHKGWRHLSICFQYALGYCSNPNSTVLDKTICVDQWKKYRAQKQTYVFLVMVQSTHNGPGRWKDWKVNTGGKTASLWRGLKLDQCLIPINISSGGGRVKQKPDIKKSWEKNYRETILDIGQSSVLANKHPLLQVSNRETNERASSGNAFALQRTQYT